MIDKFKKYYVKAEYYINVCDQAWENESLREYLTRFNKEKVSIKGAGESMDLIAFTWERHNGPCKLDLCSLVEPSYHLGGAYSNRPRHID